MRRSLDQIACTAAALLDVRLVLISLVNGPLQLFVGSHGLSKIDEHDPSPLCRDVATTGRPIVLQDARRRLPAHAQGAWEFDLVGYAGVALSLQDPTRHGAFAAITSVRRAWQSHDLHVVRCFAAAAAAVLDMRAGCEGLVDDERRGAARRLEIVPAKGNRQISSSRGRRSTTS